MYIKNTYLNLYYIYITYYGFLGQSLYFYRIFLKNKENF